MFKNKKNDETILVCSCNSFEHQIHIYKDISDNSVDLEVYLKPGNFIERLRNAIKYIFGYRSEYGDFDNFIFKEEHADELISLGNFLKNNSKNEC